MDLDIIACFYHCLAVIVCFELGGVGKAYHNQVEVIGMEDSS